MASDDRISSEEGTICTVSRSDPRYPERLKDLAGMPPLLYIIGDLPDDRIPTVGIVGARGASHYGRRTAEDFGRFLGSNGIQVISGMAEGIDCSSQYGALDGKGRTFAVLGSGVDICYPAVNRNLYEALKQHGGLISENPPGTPPLAWTFPARNRIIAGLSDLLIVVEARSRSGSLITVDFALEQGKSVFAVPGRVGDRLSDGCNRLIYDGAGIACSPEVILEELKALPSRKMPGPSDSQAPHREPPLREAYHKEGTYKEEGSSITAAEGNVSQGQEDSDTAIPSLPGDPGRVLSCLSGSDITELSQIIDESGLPAKEAASALTRLVLLGYAKEVYPGFYIRIT